jgi:hypothetical protein
MKKLILLSLAAAAASLPSVAYADPSIEFNGRSGTFENDGIAGGLFDNTFNFTVATDGNVSSTITSIAIDTITDITFSSVTLNGIEFVTGMTGETEFRSIRAVPVMGGSQTLRVRGESGGNGSYAGTLAFVAQQVPEPGTLATMAVALGFLGGGLGLSRSRRRTEEAA